MNRPSYHGKLMFAEAISGCGNTAASLKWVVPWSSIESTPKHHKAGDLAQNRVGEPCIYERCKLIAMLLQSLTSEDALYEDHTFFPTFSYHARPYFPGSPPRKQCVHLLSSSRLAEHSLFHLDNVIVRDPAIWYNSDSKKYFVFSTGDNIKTFTSSSLEGCVFEMTTLVWAAADVC